MRSPALAKSDGEPMKDKEQIDAQFLGGVDTALVQVRAWMIDIRTAMYDFSNTPEFESKSVDWVDGWHQGIAWIHHTIDELNRAIEEEHYKNG